MKKDVKETPEQTKASSLPKKEYLEVRMPRFTFRETPMNAYLVIALVIFAFALGMLTNKVMYYEKIAQGTTATNKAAPADTQAGAEAEPTPPQIVDVALGNLPVLGDQNAKVTIVEFSDFQCPFCKSYLDDTHAQLDEQYIKTGKVKFAFRHYPLTVIHPNAPTAAEASECANEQNKFWEYHDVLFKNQETWSPLTGEDLKTSFSDYATEVGLNVDQFNSCFDSGKYKQNVADDLAAGQEAQVGGTPAFFINGYRITGAVPFAELKKRIDEELNK